MPGLEPRITVDTHNRHTIELQKSCCFPLPSETFLRTLHTSLQVLWIVTVFDEAIRRVFRFDHVPAHHCRNARPTMRFAVDRQWFRSITLQRSNVPLSRAAGRHKTIGAALSPRRLQRIVGLSLVHYRQTLEMVLFEPRPVLVWQPLVAAHGVGVACWFIHESARCKHAAFAHFEDSPSV